MSYDLHFTETGDLSFMEVSLQNEEIFEFSFFVAPSNTLSFEFNIENAEKYFYYDNSFELEFYLHRVENNKRSRVNIDDEYIKQSIKLRLETEKGTVRGNKSLGCNLYKYFHSNLDNNKIIENIKNEIKNAISDILPDCTVTVSLLNSNYLDYHDSIHVVIKNNEKTYYYYL